MGAVVVRESSGVVDRDRKLPFTVKADYCRDRGRTVVPGSCLASSDLRRFCRPRYWRHCFRCCHVGQRNLSRRLSFVRRCSCRRHHHRRVNLCSWGIQLVPHAGLRAFDLDGARRTGIHARGVVTYVCNAGLKQRTRYGNATCCICSPESSHRHHRSTRVRPLPARTRAINSHAARMDQAAPHSASQGRSFRLLRSTRSRRAHPHEAESAGTGLRPRFTLAEAALNPARLFAA